MSQFFQIHPQNPQARLIRQAADIIRQGGVVAYPTDSAYALGCQLGNKNALERIRRLRQLDDKHNFTLVCRDLSELGVYAKVDNTTFRLLKATTPGPYTFILNALARCRGCCCIPSAVPSACACRTTRSPWICWRRWVSRCSV